MQSWWECPNIYQKPFIRHCFYELLNPICFVLFSAIQVSAWDATVENVTDKSFHVQWRSLTSEISQPVQTYVVLVNWTIGDNHKMTGSVLPSNTTSATINRLPSYINYQVIVIAVDDLGKPHKSSPTFVKTLEGGECSFKTQCKLNGSTRGSRHLSRV